MKKYKEPGSCDICFFGRELCYKKEDAKFIIDIEGDLTPFMLDEIASKWL